MSSSRSLRNSCWLLPVCLLTWSCSGGGGDGPELNKVAGRVTLDGQPLVGARVLFTPAGGSRPAFGLTDGRGHYQVAYTATGTGTPAGEYVVFISTFRAEEEDPETGGTVGSTPETVPAIYNTASTLNVTVPGGVYDFELKSDSPIVQPMIMVSD